MKNQPNGELSVQVDYIRKFMFLFQEHDVPMSLIRACVKSIAQNDLAHNLGHVHGVCELASQMAECRVNKDDQLKVMLAALFHDLGCRYNRDDHHLISYGLTYQYLAEYWPERFTPDEIKEIAVAVLEHRSSSKGKPTSLISEIVSVADSGKPNIEIYIKRALQFRISRGDLENKGKDVLFDEVYHHLLEKFESNTGYHWNSYPDIGLMHFKEEWDEFQVLLHPTLVIHAMRTISEIYNKL